MDEERSPQEKSDRFTQYKTGEIGDSEKREEVAFKEGIPTIPYDSGSDSFQSTSRWISITKVKISDEKMTGLASCGGLDPDRLSGAFCPC